MLYYIGDLCYVTGQDWDGLVEQVYPQLDKGGSDHFSPRYGRLDLKGVPVWMLGTEHGDGVYSLRTTNSGHEVAQLSVDSGTIGCMPAPDWGLEKREVASRLGALVEIDLAPNEMDAHENDGVLYFSNKYSVETK